MSRRSPSPQEGKNGSTMKKRNSLGEGGNSWDDADDDLEKALLDDSKSRRENNNNDDEAKKGHGSPKSGGGRAKSFTQMLLFVILMVALATSELFNKNTTSMQQGLESFTNKVLETTATWTTDMKPGAAASVRVPDTSNAVVPAVAPLPQQQQVERAAVVPPPEPVVVVTPAPTLPPTTRPPTPKPTMSRHERKQLAREQKKQKKLEEKRQREAEAAERKRREEEAEAERLRLMEERKKFYETLRANIPNPSKNQWHEIPRGTRNRFKAMTNEADKAILILQNFGRKDKGEWTEEQVRTLFTHAPTTSPTQAPTSNITTEAFDNNNNWNETDTLQEEEPTDVVEPTKVLWDYLTDEEKEELAKVEEGDERNALRKVYRAKYGLSVPRQQVEAPAVPASASVWDYLTGEEKEEMNKLEEGTEKAALRQMYRKKYGLDGQQEQQPVVPVVDDEAPVVEVPASPVLWDYLSDEEKEKMSALEDGSEEKTALRKVYREKYGLDVQQQPVVQAPAEIPPSQILWDYLSEEEKEAMNKLEDGSDEKNALRKTYREKYGLDVQQQRVVQAPPTMEESATAEDTSDGEEEETTDDETTKELSDLEKAEAEAAAILKEAQEKAEAIRLKALETAAQTTKTLTKEAAQAKEIEIWNKAREEAEAIEADGDKSQEQKDHEKAMIWGKASDEVKAVKARVKEEAAEEPASEEPTAEEPAAEEPAAEEPAAEEPTADEPVAEEPAAVEEPAEKESTPEETQAVVKTGDDEKPNEGSDPGPSRETRAPATKLFGLMSEEEKDAFKKITDPKERGAYWMQMLRKYDLVQGRAPERTQADVKADDEKSNDANTQDLAKEMKASVKFVDLLSQEEKDEFARITDTSERGAWRMQKLQKYGLIKPAAAEPSPQKEQDPVEVKPPASLWDVLSEEEKKEFRKVKHGKDRDDWRKKKLEEHGLVVPKASKAAE